MVSPGSARTTATPWTPGTARSRAVSGAAGAAGPAPATAEPPDNLVAIWSVTMFASATVPNRVTSLAFCVVIATTAAVVMNSASTRPLTARKAARGSSARRRAAISVPGRLVHRAMARAAAMVSHGPAMNRPIEDEREAGHERLDLPGYGGRVAVHGPEAELGQAGQSGITRQAPGGFGLRPASDAERGDVHPAQRHPRRHGGEDRHADRDQEDVEQAERQLAGEERLADERDGRDRDAQQEEEPEPDAVPRSAAVVDSMAAIRETCRRVAPARRIAANRSSRRAADSRVAVAMKISTGVRIASATTARMRSMELGAAARLDREVGQALGVRYRRAARAGL